MDLTLQTVLLNVTDLNQSIEFYRDVFDLRLASQGDQVAALMIYEKSRRQVLLLREIGRNAFHGGRGYIGIRTLSFEVTSSDDFDAIEQRLVERQALAGQVQLETYRAITGLDPDRIELFVSLSLTGSPIRSEDWDHIDDMIYSVE
jgi:catechol 2,3-dioxygenase-like lactoylglutathione lyase family enzyme